MNRDQALNYLIRNGADHVDQLLDWSDSKVFTDDQVKFLLEMEFSVDVCDRCGEMIYTGDEFGWYNVGGTQPKQDSATHVEVNSIEYGHEYRWTLCLACWRRLKNFAH